MSPTSTYVMGHNFSTVALRCDEILIHSLERFFHFLACIAGPRQPRCVGFLFIAREHCRHDCNFDLGVHEAVYSEKGKQISEWFLHIQTIKKRYNACSCLNTSSVRDVTF